MVGIVTRERDGELFLYITGKYRTADGTKYFDELPRREALQLLKDLRVALKPTPDEIASIGGPWLKGRWLGFKRDWDLQVRHRFDGDVDVRELPPARFCASRAARRWSSPRVYPRYMWDKLGVVL